MSLHDDFVSDMSDDEIQDANEIVNLNEYIVFINTHLKGNIS